MDRTITVKGIGKLKVAPDRIEVSMTLRSKNKEYAAAMEESVKQQDRLRRALQEIGFAPEDLKTNNFNVRTEYESERDKNGMYRQVFAGYVCEHTLGLRFPFDTDRLSKVLTALSECLAEPELYISFTVKDKDALSDALLRNAAANAKQRALLLAEASGMELGRLMTIDYSWGNPNFVSPTRVFTNAKMACRGAAEEAMDMDISAEDIELTEDATFVWEIV